MINEMFNLKINDVKDILETYLYLEYLGIHSEDAKTLGNKTIYYFSVPEKSIIKAKDEKNNEKIQTSEGLIKLAKETLLDIVFEVISKSINMNDSFDKEIFDEMKEDTSKFVEFYAKVRKGEVWTEESGNKAVETLKNMMTNNSYEKV